MQKGFIHLLEFATEAEADDAYNMLHDIWSNAEEGSIDDIDYDIMVQSVYDSAKDIIEEVDWRRHIDKNNIYDYDDGNGKIQIVNDVAVPIY